MKGADVTVFCNFCQGYIIAEMIGNVFLCPLDGDQVVPFYAGMDLTIRFIVSNGTQRFINELYNKVIDLKFVYGARPDQFQNIVVKKFCVYIFLHECGVKIIVAKKFLPAIIVQKLLLVEFVFKFKNCAFVGNGVRMRHGALIPGLGDEYAPII